MTQCPLPYGSDVAELTNQTDIAQLDLQVLRKPYRQAELARAFRAALADRPATRAQPAELTVAAKQ